MPISTEWDAEMDLISALLGAGSGMRADPSNAAIYLAKLEGQLAASDVRWSHGVHLLVKGMQAVLEEKDRGGKTTTI